jgi:hypothetical protein
MGKLKKLTTCHVSDGWSWAADEGGWYYGRSHTNQRDVLWDARAKSRDPLYLAASWSEGVLCMM